MLIEEVIEIAKNILKDKKSNKTLFINSLVDIKAHDCNINSENIVEDIGILASYNPVALDKACYDLINADSSEDKFKKMWRNIDGTLQFNYAEEIGFKTGEYELIII